VTVEEEKDTQFEDGEAERKGALQRPNKKRPRFYMLIFFESSLLLVGLS